jgi:serine/threonine protein kinase
MNGIYSKFALPVGTMVQEYRVIEVLGIGNFGIVYKAENKYFSEIVALKEFLPSELAYRLEGEHLVVPLSSETEKAYRWALHKFLEEAKTLRELGSPVQHPNIVRIRQFIEANDTAYMVMDLEEGRPLAKILEERGTLSESEIKDIFSALIDGLARVHGASVWHRDIKPSNILIRPDGSPVLIDFGAARKDISGTERSAMAVFSPAYAAPEQIYPVGDQGPWTDIYGLGATLYRAVIGKNPTNAAGRLQGKTYTPAAEAAGVGYSPALLNAIDAALELYPKDRPQSIGQWRERFAVSTGLDDDKTILRPAPPVRPKRKKGGYRGLLAMIAVLAMVAAGWWVLRPVIPPTRIEPAHPTPTTGGDETVRSKPDEKQGEQAEIRGDESVAHGEGAAKEEIVPIQAKVRIDSVPANANVYIDGEFKGVTPLDALMAGGPHLLRLSLEDYHDWESTLLIEQEVEIPIRIPLLKKEMF